MGLPAKGHSSVRVPWFPEGGSLPHPYHLAQTSLTAQEMQQDLRALAPPSLHHAGDEGAIPWEPPPGHRLPTARRVLTDRDHLGPLSGVGVKAQPAVVSEQEVERRETGLSVGSHGRAPA